MTDFMAYISSSRLQTTAYSTIQHRHVGIFIMYVIRLGTEER